jgi:hypothetical protein
LGAPGTFPALPKISDPTALTRTPSLQRLQTT